MPNEADKKIRPVLHDIRHPQKKEAKKTPARKPQKSKERPKNRFAIFVAVVFVVFAGYFFYVSDISPEGFFRNEISESQNGEKINSFFETISDFFRKTSGFIKVSRDMTEAFGELKENGPYLLFNGGGEELIGILKRIYKGIGDLEDLGIDVSEQIERFGKASGGDFANAADEVDAAKIALGDLISFLEKPGERRIALLFENQSEIRPSGGFVGSYGEVIIENGSIKDIKVDDIYYPDRRLELKVIPPIQLQSITPGWGARDANWFFDFSISAEKTLELLEASEIYVNDGVKFDGAIAFNTEFVSDILGVIGDIYVPERDVTLTKDNFIYEVREDVEESRGENPKENPKRILGMIMPTVIERLQGLDDVERQELIFSFLAGAKNKDIKFYFRDEGLQRFVSREGFAGEVFEIPDDFTGDYIAVINTNIAGGKSDIFINQKIRLNSEIDNDGKINNHLTVIRQHFGENEEEPLYRAKNQNFIKIFTPLSSELVSIDGVTPKDIEPIVDYDNSDYTKDTTLSAVEETREILDDFDAETYIESGKKVFASWFSTEAGDTGTLSLDYSAGKVKTEEGKYKFVFEKQSGVESTLEYQISAPEGFYWKESGKGTFKLREKSIPGRIVVDLTLAEM